MSFQKIEITKRALSQIRAGSLWIFANEFKTKMNELEPGAWVEFYAGGEFAGFGYANPHSLIAGRVCSATPVADRKTYIEKAIASAYKRREKLRSVGSYRAVFSESDNLPGLIVDVYGDTVVAQFNTLGIDKAEDDIVGGLEDVFKPKALVIRADSLVRSLEGAKAFSKIIKGESADLQNSVVKEHDTLFAADFLEGQKTGFFLDQRDNRAYLKSLSKDKSILDLCCYSGGWGLSALKGLAKSVTFVDQSEDALRLVKMGMELNHFSQKCEFSKADIFDFLEKTKETYDIVISDPPAFVKSKKNLAQAIKAYKKLNRLALEHVKVGGILFACSCSFHLSENDFEIILKEITQELGCVTEVVYRGGQPEDHPWVLNRPESRYLKCYGLKLLSI